MIKLRAGAWSRNCLKNVFLVGGRNDQVMFWCKHRITFRLAVAVADHPVEEAGLPHVGGTAKCPDDIALCIANRNGHVKD